MPWHLLYLTEDTRNGRTFGESSFPEWFAGEDARGEVVLGYALLSADEYTRWKRERFNSYDFVGYVLTDMGSWRPHEGFYGVDLANAHRVLPRVPKQVIASMDWEEGLKRHDVDLYFDHYDMLEERSIRFFERHLRWDTATAHVLEGLRAFAELHSGGEDLVEYAYPAAFFHRAAAVLGTYRGRSLDDPARIPGPLDEDTQAILRGYRTARETRQHCEDDETRVAAALLALLTAWQGGRKTSSWAARAIENALEREADWEDWREAFEAKRAPEH